MSKLYRIMSGDFFLRRTLWALTAAVAAGTPAAAQAQDEAVNTGRVSLGASVDAQTGYFFRGIVQETDGVIVQPGAELGVNLHDGDGPFSSLDLSVGIWNSFHSEHTGATGSGPSSWYESDLYAGLSFGLGEELAFGLTYTAYTSPNGAFSTVEEIAASLSFDDSELMGDFALSPYVTVARELNNTAMGGDEGTYLEVGIEPGLTLIEGADVDSPRLTLSFPIAAGFSLDDYYEDASGDDHFFGYVQAGAVLSAPLAFVPADYGQWTIGAGVHLLALGSSTEELNDDDDLEVIGTVGISMSY